MGQPALQVLEYLLVWFAPCKYGFNIWHLFGGPYTPPPHKSFACVHKSFACVKLRKLKTVVRSP